MYINGINLSEGVVCGNVLKILDNQIEIIYHKAEDLVAERQKAIEGISVATKYQEKLIEKYEDDSEIKEILTSYLYMIKDPELLIDIYSVIDSLGCDAEYAVKTVFEKLIMSIKMCESPYFKTRGDDLYYIMNKIIHYMLNGVDPVMNNEVIEPNTIIVANKFSPMDFAQLDFTNIVGIITASGSPTSHLAIVARASGIPAVCISEEEIKNIFNGDVVIIDGDIGNIIVNPSSDDFREFDDKLYNIHNKKIKYEKFKGLEGLTTDGIRVSVLANIFMESEVDFCNEMGAEGIGLVRTELLFKKEHGLPSFEKQLEVYNSIVTKAPGNSVVFRAFDFSSDKDYFEVIKENEENPHLGFRGIRVLLSNREIFHDQIKAMLMCGIDGDVTIIFPFITSPDEMMECESIIEEIKYEIAIEGKEYNHSVKIGAMIETPAAVLMVDEIAEYCDLLSIGTNDLIQYTLAADRGNSKIIDFYKAHHPAILRMISKISATAQEHKIPCCICGVMASDMKMTKTLIGLGVTQLSVIPANIQRIKGKIEENSIAQSAVFAKKLLSAGSIFEVETILSCDE